MFLMMSHLEAFGLVTVEAMLNGALVLGNSDRRDKRDYRER